MSRPSRRLGAALALLLAVALTPTLGTMTSADAAVATGQIVFDHGDDIWAADVDGTHAHVLVTAAQVGMDHLGAPATAPNGNVVLFTGWTDRHRFVSSHDVTFWGSNWHGTYELHGGVVRRLSPAPRPVDLARDTSDMTPEPAPDGHSYVYAHLTCTEVPILYDGYIPEGYDRSCTSHLRRAPLPGGSTGSTAFATMCDGSTPSDEASLPFSPVVDPAAATKVAYSGCNTPDGGPLGAPSQGALMLSGPHRVDEVAVALSGQARSFDDPSFSPDGRHLVAFNEGGEVDTLDGSGNVDIEEIRGGVYVYDDLSGTTSGRLLVAAPADGTDALGVTTYEAIEYPRYLGSDTIGFVYGGSVYTLPATCSGCTIGQATRIHDGGDRASTQSFGLAWTSRTIAPYRPPAQHLSLGKVHAQRVRSLVRHGVKVHATCRLGCRLDLELTVGARQARRLGLGRHHGRVRIGHRRVHLRGGVHAVVRVRLTRHARRVLKKAHRWSMRLTATPHPGGHAKAAHRRIPVRR